MDEQELNKKLAECAGFRVNHPTAVEMDRESSILLAGKMCLEERYLFPNNSVGYMPNFPQSLDACFKWLAPIALGTLAKEGYSPPIMKLFQLWYDELVTLSGDSSNVNQAALALCLAIEKLVDGGN